MHATIPKGLYGSLTTVLSFCGGFESAFAVTLGASTDCHTSPACAVARATTGFPPAHATA